MITNTISHSAKEVYDYVLNDLKHRLPEKVTYHTVRHTLDVVASCKNYIEIYDIDSEPADLLLIAAVAHDYGFVISPEDHEKRSSDLVSKIMKEHGFSSRQARKVRGLIMATKIPQSPTNFHEEIIADSDLDYLGRYDYPEISETFFIELQNFDVISTEKDWYNLQIKFLSNHTYFTEWARTNRQPVKERRIEMLKAERKKKFRD